jgi:hypothetical protein
VESARSPQGQVGDCKVQSSPHLSLIFPRRRNTFDFLLNVTLFTHGGLPESAFTIKKNSSPIKTRFSPSSIPTHPASLPSPRVVQIWQLCPSSSSTWFTNKVPLLSSAVLYDNGGKAIGDWPREVIQCITPSFLYSFRDCSFMLDCWITRLVRGRIVVAAPFRFNGWRRQSPTVCPATDCEVEDASPLRMRRGPIGDVWGVGIVNSSLRHNTLSLQHQIRNP